MLFLIVLFYAVTGYIELHAMLRKGKRKETLVYAVFIAAAFILSIIAGMGIRIPSPADPLERIVSSIVGIK